MAADAAGRLAVGLRPGLERRRVRRRDVGAFDGFFAKVFFAAIGVAWLIPAFASGGEKPVERTYVTAPNAPAFQTWTQADGKSAGCVSCHTVSDRKT
ncbi:MAG TPA: hypothetical protein VM555_00020, partial [Tahibacter sp.]|nr:hypothetical protein [Tahibacter sp.]